MVPFWDLSGTINDLTLKKISLTASYNLIAKLFWQQPVKSPNHLSPILDPGYNWIFEDPIGVRGRIVPLESPTDKQRVFPIDRPKQNRSRSEPLSFVQKNSTDSERRAESLWAAFLRSTKAPRNKRPRDRFLFQKTVLGSTAHLSLRFSSSSIIFRSREIQNQAFKQPIAMPMTSSIRVHEYRLGHLKSIQMPNAIPITVGMLTDHPTSPNMPSPNQTD